MKNIFGNYAPPTIQEQKKEVNRLIQEADKFYLGRWANDEGEIYAEVYDDQCPNDVRQFLADRADGLWNQICFEDKNYFKKSPYSR